MKKTSPKNKNEIKEILERMKKRKLEREAIQKKKEEEELKIEKLEKLDEDRKSTQVQKIRSQIEKKIRKSDEDRKNDKKIELMQNSPISKRKLNSENRRKLQSSMKKVVQSNKQFSKQNIQNNQRSIWEFWGVKEKKKDTRGGTFDVDPNL